MNQLIDITDSPEGDANDILTAKNIAEKLHQHYPGHLWAVTCEGKKGIATIRNLRLSYERPYVLHLKTIYGDPHLRCVLRAGGHILEAYQQPRGMVNPDKIDSLPHMLNGYPIMDADSLKPKARNSYLRELARNEWHRIQHWLKSKRPSIS